MRLPTNEQIVLCRRPGTAPPRAALTRRTLIRACAGALGAASLPGRAAQPKPVIPEPRQDDRQELSAFLARFMMPDGRIVDTANEGVSHSEGQGIAMLAVAHFGTPAEFRCLHDWTRHNLAHGGDALHAWRYRPAAARRVDDPNNATDGDLLIAHALLVAAERWNRRDYRAAGLAIARDIKALLVRSVGDRLVLLPGMSGFERRDGITVNPSYYVFPSLHRIAADAPDPVWNRVIGDGLALLQAARFGRWTLPPDWLHVARGGAGLAPASQWPARFSFDAVRLPLYLCWGGYAAHPVASSSARFWARNDSAGCPAWIDLVTNHAAPYAQGSGMRAIRQFVDSAVVGRQGECEVPPVEAAADYYAAALTLLVRIARAPAGKPIA